MRKFVIILGIMLSFFALHGASTFASSTLQDSTELIDDLQFTEIGSAEDSLANVALQDSSLKDSLAKSPAPAIGGINGGADLNAADNSSKTLWQTFIEGLIGGFIAFLMPCIFPMVPLTVSYFTKRAGSRQRGIFQALIYGASIIVIYVAFGLLITLLFGSAKLNELSSSGWFNIAFFTLLVVFAISFFGTFEITLPSSFVNKIDAKADSGKGLGGIFFMAASLALVSFSCTGPIIGTLLVQASAKGEILAPAIGMSGFALALALPFTLSAVFPGFLNRAGAGT
jgi:thiol:disulfide interchange protein